MSDECPPPYSAALADTLVVLPISEPLHVTLPFSSSDDLAAKILALVSEGKTLDSHFRDVRDIACAGSNSDCHEHAVILCQIFEKLVWESRNTAGTALVAIKDFSDVVLDFLSQPDAIQDKLHELANASKLLQPERVSAANQKTSFDALIERLEDFHTLVTLELDAPTPKKRRQSSPEEGESTSALPYRYDVVHFSQRGIPKDDPLYSRKSIPPHSVPHLDPFRCFSAVTASIGVISRSIVDCAQHFERMAEQAISQSSGPDFAHNTPAEALRDPTLGITPLNSSIRKRLAPRSVHDELEALPDLVRTLLGNLRAFVNRVDIFNTVLAELARAQDVLVVYLKDGQSITSQGYRVEIARLRAHLPRVCNALDAYSKGRLS